MFESEHSKCIYAKEARSKAEANLLRVVELHDSARAKVEELERPLKEAVERRCKDITSLQEQL